MHDEHTLMDSKTFERPLIAVLSTGRSMPLVTLLIIPTVDVNALKSEDSSSLLDSVLRVCESAGSPSLEGTAL